MVGRSALSHTYFITNVQPQFTYLGLVCATPCTWHSAATDASSYTFSFEKAVAFFGSWQKDIQGNFKHFEKNYLSIL